MSALHGKPLRNGLDQGDHPRDGDGNGNGNGNGDSRSKKRLEMTPSQRALGLLARREHSHKELVAKLSARGVPADEAERTVQRMAGEGWQDDRRFAEGLARMRMANGYGPIRIRAELGTHGLGEDIAGNALDALDAAGDADWSARARALVRRRYGDAALLARQPQLCRKAADFLIRRGFDGDCVRHALRASIDD